MKGKVINGTAGNKLAVFKDSTPAFQKALVIKNIVTYYYYIGGEN